MSDTTTLLPGAAGRLVRPDAVHRDVYKDPVVFAAEMDRIFKGTWVFVGHETQVPEPGDFASMRIGTEPVIFVRGDDRRVRVLVNRCRHRAATVCQVPSGHCEQFKCQYHGWIYGTDGELRAVPHVDRHPLDVHGRLDLLPVPRVESYRGLVFASFNPAVPSLHDHLGPAARGYLDRWLDHAAGHSLVAHREAHRVVTESNWKLQTENGLDGYHGPFTHRSFFSVMQRRTGQNVRFASSLPTALAKAFDHGHCAVDPETTSKAPLRHRVTTLPDAAELLARVAEEVAPDELEPLLDGLAGPGINIGIYPNLQLIGIQLRRIEPISVGRTVVTVRPLMVEGVPEAYNELRLRYHELFYGPAGFGQPDDLEMFDRVDDGLDDTSDEWLLLERGVGMEVHRDGALVGNVSDELPMRSQFLEWIALMEPTRG